MQIILQATKIVLSLIFLGYASWSDIKTREVSNKTWFFYGPLGFSLTLLDSFLHGNSDWLLFGISITVTWSLAISLFYLGAFGGADAKAFMCIALAFPTYPEKFLQIQYMSGHPILPLTVFTNSIFLAALSSIYMLLHNLLWRLRTGSKLFEGMENESFWRKTLTILCGYKVSLEKLKGKNFYFPMEDVKEKDGIMKHFLVVFPKDEDRNEILDRLSLAVENERISSQIWASPGLPMLVFITGGFLVAVFFGDLVWFLVSLILG